MADEALERALKDLRERSFIRLPKTEIKALGASVGGLARRCGRWQEFREAIKEIADKNNGEILLELI